MLLLFVLLASFLASSLATEKANCTQAAEEVDSIIKAVLLMEENPMIPTNQEKLDQWCNLTMPLSKKVSKYAPCQEAYPKQVTNMFASDVKKPINYICKTNRDDSISHYGCLESNHLKKVLEISKKLLYSFSKLKNVPVNEIVPRACCSILDALDSTKKLDAPSKSECASTKVAQWMHDRMQSSTAETVDLVCGDLQSIEKCQSEKASILQAVREAPPADFDHKKHLFLPTLLEGLARLSA